ncbi:hypothetical protein K504DRAFT_334527, partial [Pleomassaria siparia CBS 279.74]
DLEQLESAKCISGPHELFSGSFILEALEVPPTLNATVLLRARYVWNHPTSTLGKSHPQSPPLHLHFDQCETFFVAQGKVGTTTTWACVDRAWSREDAAHEIETWVPHRFWPHPEAGEDTVMYVYAHPNGVEEPMDWLFFKNLLSLVSDMSEGTTGEGGFATMLRSRHASATALVMFPTAWWLGPLRWWVPWKFQAGMALFGRLLGY